MERILNKIDNSLREKVNEITKEGKIHSVKDNEIYTDNKSKRDNKDNTKAIRKSYLVQAEKCEKYEVEAFENEDKNKTLGRFLDIKE